jgi:hypothetical protein
MLGTGSMTLAVGVRLMVLGETPSTTVESVAPVSGSIGLAWTMAGTAMPARVSMPILEVVSSSVDAAIPTVVSILAGESTLVGAAMLTVVSILAGVSTLVGAAMPTVVSMLILVVVGDGAGESVDPDPVVPTVGAN